METIVNANQSKSRELPFSIRKKGEILQFLLGEEQRQQAKIKQYFLAYYRTQHMNQKYYDGFF